MRNALADTVVERHERTLGVERLDHRAAPAAGRWRTAASSRSSGRSGSVSTCGRGISRLCPGNSGRLSRKATVDSSSSTMWASRSPRTIAQKAQDGSPPRSFGGVKERAPGRRSGGGPVGGAFGRRSCSTCSMLNPALRISSSVGRLQLQPCADAAPQRCEAILPARQPRLLGAHVLQEQKRPSRPQHPAQLRQRPLGTVDRAQRKGRNRRVERVVGERQRTRPARASPRPSCRAGPRGGAAGPPSGARALSGRAVAPRAGSGPG